VSLDHTTVGLDSGKTLSLVGQSVRLDGATLTAAGGRVHAIGIEKGESSVHEPETVFTGTGGSVGLTGSRLDVSDDKAGTIVIRGGRLAIESASLTATTSGATDGSPIAVALLTPGTLTITKTTSISTTAAGAGRAGDIRIGDISAAADQVQISSASSLKSSSSSTGTGGAVHLHANQLDITNATLTTEVSGRGKGGDVTIEATNIRMDNGNIASLDRNNRATSAGTITVRGSGLTMVQNAAIRTLTNTAGPGGNLLVSVGDLSITGGAKITSSTEDAGRAGDVAVTATTSAFIADSESQISTSSFGAGAVGDLVMHVGTLTLTRAAQIQAGSFAGTGGGKLDIEATGSIQISGGAGILSQASNGNVGAVTIRGPEVLIDSGFISTGTVDLLNAGDVSLKIGNLSLVNGGQIASGTDIFSSGSGGKIDITATGRVLISGRSQTGQSVIPEPFSAVDGSSGIFSTTTSLNALASGGTITVTAPSLTLTEGGKLSVATSGPGAAGSIILRVGTLNVQAGASVNSGSSDSGNAGAIDIQAGKVTLVTGGRIDGSTSSAGLGGTIGLQLTDSLILSQAGTISSGTSGTGQGGAINITSRSIDITNGGHISANSTGTDTALAGDINITFGDTLSTNGGSITTAAQSASGGNINIVSTGSTLEVFNGLITTSVQSGAGGGGNINIGSSAHGIGLVLLSNSQVLARAIGGPGGNITMFAETYLNSGSIVDASSVANTPGIVNVSARITDLSGSVTQLPGDTLQAANLLRSQVSGAGSGRQAEQFSGGQA
jgi:large exoprotein involved in heme utilization and adhesion